MNTSDQINELAGALAKAQGAFANAEKDRENAFFKNRYVTLTSVWDAIRQPLSDNGLAVVQVTDTDTDGTVTLITRLIHSSGQYIEATYPVIGLDNRGINAAQAAGSALTYARRYSLSALVGVVADEDDDANAAAGERQPAKAQPQRQPPAAQPKPSAGPTGTHGTVGPRLVPGAEDGDQWDDLPSASAERNGKQAPASAHDPAAPWNDNRKAEAVRWAMRRYPELFKAAPHAMNSLNNCIEAITENGAVNVAPDVIARAWKNKCENKQAELEAAKDAAAGITDADLDAQAAAEEKALF